MKLIFSVIFIFSACLLYGQEKVIKKPIRVLIINNEIVTMEKAEEYQKAGSIKGMRNGVSDEERKQLAEKLGDRIPDDGMFISIITLYTESEKRQNKTKATTGTHALANTDEGYVLKINDTAKDFTVKMVDGTSVRLSDLKGKVVLLNFWATWCAPCIMEFYEIPSKIIQPFKNKEFVFLTISAGETEDKVIAAMTGLKNKGIDFNSGFDTDKIIWNQYGRDGIPKNFLIDQNGIIKYVSSGYNDAKLDVMALEIKKLLSN